MLVRDSRGRRRSPALGAVATAITIAVACPHVVLAQDTTASVPPSHTVKRGDTLWDLAKLYLGDPFLWPEIYRLNTDIIQDPHWIYPGEVLKLGPLARVIAVAPPVVAPGRDTVPPVVAAQQQQQPQPQVRPQPVVPEPTVLVPTVIPEIVDEQEPEHSIVRTVEYAAAPWVDRADGPRGSGRIVEARDLPGIRSKDQSRMQLFDRVVLVPPEGASTSVRALYLSYRLGPFVEHFGQIVVPTGVIEVVRSPKPGEATVGRVVKMFNEVEQGNRLIPFDTSVAVVHAAPLPVTDGTAGKIRWVLDEHVLPSLQNYVLVDISKDDGVRVGDQIELYMPKHDLEDEDLAVPELYIGRAQVMRVTEYGASAIITGQEQPKIERGTAVRVAAKRP